jgi:hypothetical protein
MVAANKVDLWNMALARIGETALVASETEDRPAALLCDLYYDDVLREVFEARVWPWALRQRILADITTQTQTYTGDGVRVQYEFSFGFVDTTQIVVKVAGVTKTPVTDYTITESIDGDQAYITFIVAPGALAIEIIVTTSNVGWDYAYIVPEDCVTPIGLVSNDTPRSHLPVGARPLFQVMINDSSDGLILYTDMEASEFQLEYVAMITYVPAFTSGFKSAVAWRLAEELAYSIMKSPEVALNCRAQYSRALDEVASYAMNVNETGEDMVATPSLVARG